MKNSLIGGTILLTITGLITRLIGFFYRIYLSNALGARLLGIYQLIFPVYGICFTIFASGVQTAISKQVAEKQAAKDIRGTSRFLTAGLMISITTALLLSVLLFFSCNLTAKVFLKEPECAGSLQILSLAFPFCGITACINGYCYGLKKSVLPAASQLVEQIVRVVFLMLLALSAPVSCELAIQALVAGETSSCLFCIAGVSILKRRLARRPLAAADIAAAAFNKSKSSATGSIKTDIKKLLSISSSLTANRLFISILHSFESFLVPLTLRRYGLSRDEALSIFGILSGMTMSFLMFPGTLTNSLSVLLLPAVSEAQAQKNQRGLEKSVSVSIKYSVLLGIFSGFFFFFFGKELGIVVFSEEKAGTYLACLSFLCPFLYLSTTLSSILNGLGSMNLTFLSSVLGLTLRVILFAVLIPRCSVYGYFISFLVSQLFLTFFDLLMLRRSLAFPFDAVNAILKPSLLLLPTASFFFRTYEFLAVQTSLPRLLLLGACGLAMTICSLILFFITGVCSKKDLP